jgi:Na+-transporting methylmalonyl-CoA/oxaloacetate decarboxylase gamma subunit
MGLVWVVLLVVILIIAQMTLMTAAIVSIVRKDVPNEDKIGWILLIVLVGIIGPVFYFVVGSKELDEEAAAYAKATENY